ncbi:glutathione S-transferase-like [Convolutriloba macropyga]|uniref:glutathione S-transferase-like n=1 Tax=Convolutriloba macropyga TaxID=536237 RepID=UPI003F51C936
MPDKLTYFDMKGAGELTRLLFAYKEYTFEDDRVQGADWPSKKPTTPLGAMPVLTLENGNEYCQGTSVARYYANKFGLAGTTEEEKLHADMVVDTVRGDMWPLFVGIFFQPDEAKKPALKADAQEKVSHWLSKLNANYIKGEGTVLASGLSWADLALFNAVTDLLPIADMTLDASFTNIKAVVDKVAAEPKIAAWVTKRPQTGL